MSSNIGTRRMIALAVVGAAISGPAAPIAAQGVRIIEAGRVVAERGRPIPVSAESSLTREDVLVVQGALERAGFDPGPHDGRLGPSVRRALEAFQVDRGLLPCGCLDRGTVRALGLRPRDEGSSAVEILVPSAPPAPAAVVAAPPPVDAPSPSAAYPDVWWWPVAPVAGVVPAAPRQAPSAIGGRSIGLRRSGILRAGPPPRPRPPGR